MNGDVWKFKHDNGLIRQIIYFMMDLRTSLSRYGYPSIFIAILDIPGVGVVNNADVTPHGFDFSLNEEKPESRWFRTCDGCGDILEMSIMEMTLCPRCLHEYHIPED